MNRRVLIVSHHFPPSTVAASFRPLRLAKYLPRIGYKVWVLSTTAAAYSSQGRMDQSLLRELPPSVHVTRLPNVNPILWYGSRRSYSSTSAPGDVTKNRCSAPTLRSSVAELAKFPDIDASWAAVCLIPALYLVLRHRIEIIYTSGPPFGAHLLGLALKRLTGCTWLAQYGNPWTANPCISWNSRLLRNRCERLDKSIVRTADAVLVLDDVLAQCIHELGRHEGVYEFPNGFDPEHFDPTDPPTGRFTITYAGSLYNVHNPQIIYDSLSVIERRDPAARADICVCFAGPAESDPLRAGAPSDVVFTGPMAHSDLVAKLNDSHVLLDFLTAPSDEKLTISCKLYEYMAARRPILAVTPEGPMAHEVRRLNLGKIAPCDDPAAVADAILDLYRDYKSGTLSIPESADIDPYSAPRQAEEFARIAERTWAGGRSK